MKKLQFMIKPYPDETADEFKVRLKTLIGITIASR